MPKVLLIFENFEPPTYTTTGGTPAGNLNGQGSYTLASDSSGGTGKATIDATGLINPIGNQTVVIQTPLGGSALYIKNYGFLTLKEWEISFDVKLLSLGSSLQEANFFMVNPGNIVAVKFRLFPGDNPIEASSTTGLINIDNGQGSSLAATLILNTKHTITVRQQAGSIQFFVDAILIDTISAALLPNGDIDKTQWQFQKFGGGSATLKNNFAVDNFSISNLIPPFPPSAPINLTAAGFPNQINLSWTAPADPGTDPIIGYKIFRSTVSEAETFFTTVGDVLAFTDTAVVNGQEYFYKVLAFSAAGDGDLSNEDSAIPIAPPSPPLNLRVVAADSQNTLTWDPPASPGGIIIAYRVYRALISGTLGTKTLITTLGNIFGFTDIGLTNGTTYYYQVTAETNPEGPASNEANGTPSSNAIPAAPKNVFTNQRENYAILSWDRVTEREDGHSIASDTYATGFEPPVFAITDLKNQDGWLQTFQTAVGFDITVQSAIVIEDLQSAQFNFTGQGLMIYQKVIPVISDVAYEVSWKWFMDTIVADPHTYSFNFEMRDGITGKILVQLFNDNEVLLSTGGTPVTAVADSGGTHEYKIRITPNAIDPIAGVGTVDLFVDNVKILSRTAVAIARADRIELSGDAQATYVSGSGFIDKVAVRLIGLADVTQYNISRSLNMNESDRKQIATITTKDVENFVDTAFVDLHSNDVKIYRVSAVILDAGNQLESSLSDRAVAIKLPSQIDRKEEVLDRRIMKWGTGTWGQLWGG